MGEKPIQSMEISQYSIAGHRYHFTNKVERGGNAYMNRAYTQTPPFPVVVFPDLRAYACVCVCTSLTQLASRFRVRLTRRPPSTVLLEKQHGNFFDFRRGEISLFFFFPSIRRRDDARREYRRIKGKRSRATSIESTSSEMRYLLHGAISSFMFRFILSSNNVLMNPPRPFNPRIFLSWKICI